MKYTTGVRQATRTYEIGAIGKCKAKTLFMTGMALWLVFPGTAQSRPQITTDNTDVKLSSENYEVTVDKKSGIVTFIQFTGQNQNTVILSAAKPGDGLLCYAISPQDNKMMLATSTGAGLKIDEGKTEYGDFCKLLVPLRFTEKPFSDFLSPTLICRIYDQFVEFDFEMYYTMDYNASFEMGAGQAGQAFPWQQVFFPTMFGAADIFEPGKMEPTPDFMGQTLGPDAVLQYSGAVWDTMTSQGRIRYPYGISETKNGFMLWGNLDVNSFMLLSPNRNGRSAGFVARPKRVQRDNAYSFRFIYKYFPKPQYAFTEVCRWYAENLYSSNPVSKGKVRLPKDLKPRTVPVGNVSGTYPAGATYPHTYNKHTPETIQRIDKLLAETRGKHLWWNCSAWDKTYPTRGTWVSYDGDGWPMDADKLHRAIKRHHDLGHLVYSYTTPLTADVAFSDEYPRYNTWRLSTKPGTYFVYPMGPYPIDKLKVGKLDIPEGWKEYVSVKEGLASEVHTDLAHPEYRAWFIDRLKKFLQEFDVDGIAWDYGWDAHCAPSMVFPNTAPQHGTVAVFHEMYDWMTKNYPEKRIINNMYLGCPTHLYCHGIMFEGCPQITKRAVDSVKFYRTALTGLYYGWQFKQVFKDKWKEEWSHRILRNLSYGVTYANGNVSDANVQEYHVPLQNIFHFSALANNTPMVIESKAIELSPESKDVTAAVWGCPERTLVAVYSDHLEDDVAVTLRIRADAARSYGMSRFPCSFQLINQRGERLDECDFARVEGAKEYTIKGILPARHLLLAQ